MDDTEWHIAVGTSVLLASPSEAYPSGLSLEFHASHAVGESTSRGDLFLDAISKRAHVDPEWVSDMISWSLDH
jgi:hypothetical protein